MSFLENLSSFLSILHTIKKPLNDRNTCLILIQRLHSLNKKSSVATVQSFTPKPTGSVIPFAGKKAIQVVFRVVSNRKVAFEKMRISEENFREMFLYRYEFKSNVFISPLSFWALLRVKNRNLLYDQAVTPAASFDSSVEDSFRMTYFLINIGIRRYWKNRTAKLVLKYLILTRAHSLWVTNLRQYWQKISMDGKGRTINNVFVERLWWSVKYWGYISEELWDSRCAKKWLSRIF